jgi:hypothetical protein
VKSSHRPSLVRSPDRSGASAVTVPESERQVLLTGASGPSVVLHRARGAGMARRVEVETPPRCALGGPAHMGAARPQRADDESGRWSVARRRTTWSTAWPSPSGLFERERRVAEIFALAVERARLGRVVYRRDAPRASHRSICAAGPSRTGAAQRSVRHRAARGHDRRIRQRIVAYRARPGGALASHDLPGGCARAQAGAIDDVLMALADGSRLPLPSAPRSICPGLKSCRTKCWAHRAVLGHRRVRPWRRRWQPKPVVAVDPSGNQRETRLSHELVLGLTHDLLAPKR